MGIIIITVIFLVLGIFLLNKVFINIDFLYEFLGPLLCMVSSIALFLEIIAIIIINITAIGDIPSYNQRYEALYYQAENQMYSNDNEVGKKELVDQITEWNSDLAFNKAMHDNKWVNWFFPIDYDQFKFIPIEMVGGASNVDNGGDLK